MLLVVRPRVKSEVDAIAEDIEIIMANSGMVIENKSVESPYGVRTT